MTASPARPPQIILRVADLPAAIRFYAGRLAFHISQRDDAAGVAMVIGPGDVPLLLAARPAILDRWQGVPEARPGAWVYLRRPDLAGLRRELAERSVPAGAIFDGVPGYLHLQASDPDGYLITFWDSLLIPDDEVIAMYRTGPDRLMAALADATEADLDRAWAPGKWTLRELVHHIVDSEMGTFHPLRMALAFPGRQIRTDLWEPDEIMAGLHAARRQVAPGVKLFAANREWLLDVLDTLPDGLDRWVSWPSGYRAQVRDLLRQVGGHALHHICQIETARRQS